MLLFTLLKNDMKLFARDWKAVLLLLVTPFAFIAFFVYALSPHLEKSSFLEPFSVALVDMEDTTQTRILVKQLEEINIFKEIIRAKEEEAKKLIAGNEIAAVIIIPPRFSESIAIGENKPVTVIGNKSMPLQAYVVKNLVQSAANMVTAAQSAINTIYEYNKKAGVNGSELEKQFNDSTMRFFLEALSRSEIFSQLEASPLLDLTPGEYYTAALIVIFLMFAGMPGMKMLVTEKNLGITERLNTTTVKARHMIISKFIMALLLSAMQFLIIIILTSLVFKNYWGAPVKNILLVFGSTLFAVSAWSVLVAAVSKTSAAADVIANLGILLMAVTGGSIYPLSSMPDFIRLLSYGTINRWSMEGFMILFSGNEALSVTNQVYALLAIGMAMLLTAICILRLKKAR
ncbi:MAG: ABC transporter permease [Clostridia bacterium]|nr:ABC transporter permease [Clostridia bacterium]